MTAQETRILGYGLLGLLGLVISILTGLATVEMAIPIATAIIGVSLYFFLAEYIWKRW